MELPPPGFLEQSLPGLIGAIIGVFGSLSAVGFSIYYKNKARKKFLSRVLLVHTSELSRTIKLVLETAGDGSDQSNFENAFNHFQKSRSAKRFVDVLDKFIDQLPLFHESSGMIMLEVIANVEMPRNTPSRKPDLILDGLNHLDLVTSRLIKSLLKQSSFSSGSKMKEIYSQPEEEIVNQNSGETSKTPKVSRKWFYRT